MKKRKNKAKHFWRRVATWLSVLVVFCTTYVLILPAVTLEAKTYCGKAEHAHTAECYETVESNETQIFNDTSDSDEESSDFVNDKNQKSANTEKTPICGKEEHKHSHQCRSNIGKVETNKQWKQSLPEVEDAKNSLSELVYLTAEKQLDYKPIYENYQVQEDGTDYYWNRYGALVENPYSQQSSAFVNFVLKYSDSTLPWDLDLIKWQNLQYANSEEGTDAALWQQSWKQVSMDEAKRGAIVLFQNEDNQDEEEQSSTRSIESDHIETEFESQPVETENQPIESPDLQAEEENAALQDTNLKAGILAEDLASKDETSTESGAELSNESTEMASDNSSTSNPSEDPENSSIEDILVISTWKNQVPERTRVKSESIVGIYQVQNDVIDPTHRVEEDKPIDTDTNQDTTNQDQNATDQSGDTFDQDKNATTDPSQNDQSSGQIADSQPSDPAVTDPEQSDDSVNTDPATTETPDPNSSDSADQETETSDSKTEDGETKDPEEDAVDETVSATTSNKVVVATKPNMSALPNTGSNTNNQLSQNIIGSGNIEGSIQQEIEAENTANGMAKAARAVNINIIYELNTPQTVGINSINLTPVYGYTYNNPNLTSNANQTISTDDGLVMADLTSYEYRVDDNNDAKYGSAVGDSKSVRTERKVTYYFQGWKAYIKVNNRYQKISDNDEIYRPNQKLTGDKLSQLNEKAGSQKIYFRGAWSPVRATRVGTAIFSVNTSLGAKTNYYEQNPDSGDDNWVDGVYSTAVISKDANTGNVLDPNDAFPVDTNHYLGGGYSASVIAYQNSGGSEEGNIPPETDTMAKTDSLIRSMTNSTGITGQFQNVKATNQGIGYSLYSGTYNFRLASFPSDDQVLAQLRTYQSTANGNDRNKYIVYADGNNETGYRKIESKDLIPDNFTIQWYVFKLNWDGFWHIDGKLVAKDSYLKITKTFSGEEKAKKAIEKGNRYSITVTDETQNKEGTKIHSDIFANLVLSENTTQSPSLDELTVEGLNKQNISAAKNPDGSYTWIIPVHAFENYALKENNYKYINNTGENIVTLAQYNITNESKTGSTSQDTSTSKLLTYSEDGIVAVATRPYLDSEGITRYQSVNFRNSYYDTSAVLLQKTDATNGNLLSGAKFKLEKLDINNKPDESSKFYYQEVTNSSDLSNLLYICPAPATETQELPDNTFTIYKDMAVFLKNFKDKNYDGKYQLTEIEAPNGYSKLEEPIQFTVTNGEITLSSHAYVEPIKDNDQLVAIQIMNTSTPTRVKVEKVWNQTDGNNVKVFLYRNGTRLTNEPEILNGGNSWTKEWTDLPSYVDGQKAVYTVREREITVGKEPNTHTYYYDEKDDSEDGFAGYVVTYTKTEDENGNVTLKVTNTKDDGQQSLRLNATKIDQFNNKLSDAEFKLYKYQNSLFDENTKETVLTALGQDIYISGQDGSIHLPLLDTGYYALEEVKAPDGYNLLTEVFYFEVNNDAGTVSLVRQKHTSGEASYFNPDESNPGINSWTIRNTTGQKLPETGGEGTHYYTSGGILLIAASCLLYTFSKKQPYRKGEQ